MLLITYSYNISYFLGGSLALCHIVTLKMLLTYEIKVGLHKLNCKIY